MNAMHITPELRLTVAKEVVDNRLPVSRAAEKYAVSTSSVEGWASVYRREGEAGVLKIRLGGLPRKANPFSLAAAQPDPHARIKELEQQVQYLVVELVELRYGVRLQVA